MSCPKNARRLFAFDLRQTSATARVIAGLDEAGRGPLAGPVIAAAVIFIRPVKLPFLNDSKQVKPAIRRKLFWDIAKSSLIGIGKVDEQSIDAVNIYQATRLAMKQALLSLTRTPDLILVDGPLKIDFPISQRPLIKGDQKSASIAAASIIAKVYRDEWMCCLDKQFPAYEFYKHKGYATARHLQLLAEHGPSPVHRRSFRPIRPDDTKDPLDEVSTQKKSIYDHAR